MAIGDFVAVGANGLKIVLVGEEGVGGAAEARADGVMHGVDDVLMPQKTVPVGRAEVADAEIGNAAQALPSFPRAGFWRARRECRVRVRSVA